MKIDRLEACSPLASVWNVVRRSNTKPFLEVGEIDAGIARHDESDWGNVFRGSVTEVNWLDVSAE